jgi:hypothetical protein
MIMQYTQNKNMHNNLLPENISKKSLLSMVIVASACEGGFPSPAEPLSVLRSIYNSPDSEPASEHISNKRMFYCLPSHHQYNTVRNSTQAYFNIWTVVHNKFSPIIHFSYAKFELSQTAAKQTF